MDQAHSAIKILECCANNSSSSQNDNGSNGSGSGSNVANPNSVVALTAARGRGKSAASILCLASAISLGYSILCVTAPNPENTLSVFEFFNSWIGCIEIS